MRKQRRRSASLFSLSYLNTKFQASSHFLRRRSLICVGPGRKPRRPVYWRRGSYSKTGVYPGIHYFLIFALKHRLLILVRTASDANRQPMFWVRIRKNITFFHLKINSFTAVKYCSILHGHICVMSRIWGNWRLSRLLVLRQENLLTIRSWRNSSKVCCSDDKSCAFFMFVVLHILNNFQNLISYYTLRKHVRALYCNISRL